MTVIEICKQFWIRVVLCFKHVPIKYIKKTKTLYKNKFYLSLVSTAVDSLFELRTPASLLTILFFIIKLDPGGDSNSTDFIKFLIISSVALIKSILVLHISFSYIIDFSSD